MTEKSIITDEMKRSCESVMPPIIETLTEMIARVDPEFQKAIRNNIVLAGCGSQIRGITDYIKDALKSFGSCQVSTVEDPLFAGANGSLALAQEMPKKYWKKLNKQNPGLIVVLTNKDWWIKINDEVGSDHKK